MTAIRSIADFYAVQLRLLWTWRGGYASLARRATATLVIAAAALAVTSWLVPGIVIRNVADALVAALVLGALNALVRPLLVGLLSAISLLAIGAGSVAFQVIAFAALARSVPGVRIGDLADVLVGSLVFALANTLLGTVVSIGEEGSYYGTLVRLLAARRRDVERSEKAGVVIVQIDGLAHPVLAHQIRAGRLPTISRWIRSNAMTLDSWTTLLPSQTSASQAGILWENDDGIPAFRWWEKDTQRLLVSNRPADALEIERRVAHGGDGLLVGGASVGNLFSGGAARSYLTLAKVRDEEEGLGASSAFSSFFISPYGYLHTIVLAVGEIAKELVQARREIVADVVPRGPRGLRSALARATTSVVLRRLSASLVIEEMYRGTPVIYVDFTDYDEIAHHAGPERVEALDALQGLDGVLRSFVTAAADAPRPYRFVVISDHGQSQGATFRQRYGESLEQLVHRLTGGPASMHAATAPLARHRPFAALVSEVARARGVTAALARAALRAASRGEKRAGQAARAAEEPPDLVVCASGNLALIYFPRIAGRVDLETIERRFPQLVGGLVRHPGIGSVMVRSTERGAVVLGAGGLRELGSGRVDGHDPLATLGPHAADGLRHIDGMRSCGDIVVLSMVDPSMGEVAAFEELVGSHGGLGGAQTEAVILHPSDWKIEKPLVGPLSVHRQLRRWIGSKS